MGEEQGRREKKMTGVPPHWGDPVGQESCRRIDGDLSRLGSGWAWSFDRAKWAVILSGGEIEG